MGRSVLDAIRQLEHEDTLFVSKEGTGRYGSDPEWDYELLKSHQQWVRDAIVLSQRTEESISGPLSHQSKGLATRILARSFGVPRDPVALSALLKRLALSEAALECHLISLVRTIGATKEPDSLWRARSDYLLGLNGFHDWANDLKECTSESSLLYLKLVAASERMVLPVVDADTAKTLCHSMVLGGDIGISSQFAWSILEQSLAAYIPIIDAHDAAIDSLNSDIAKLDSTLQKIEYDERMTSYLSEKAQILENAGPLRGMMWRYSGKQLLAVLGIPPWLSIWLPVVKAQKEADLAREAAQEAEMKAYDERVRVLRAEEVRRLISMSLHPTAEQLAALAEPVFSREPALARDAALAKEAAQEARTKACDEYERVRSAEKAL